MMLRSITKGTKRTYISNESFFLGLLLMFVFVLDFWIYILSVQLPNTYLHKHLLLYHNIFWIFSPKKSIFHDTFTISFDTNAGKYYIMINVIYIIIAYSTILQNV